MLGLDFVPETREGEALARSHPCSFTLSRANNLNRALSVGALFHFVPAERSQDVVIALSASRDLPSERQGAA
jgi:hypothetical protein